MFEQKECMQKDDLNMHVFQNKNCSSPKSDFFFLTFTVRGPFHRKDFEWKKNMGVLGSFLKKKKSFVWKLNKRGKTATSSYSVTGDVLQYINSMAVTKHHQNIRLRCS